MNIEEFDNSITLLDAILWQYNNSTRIQSLLKSKDNWYFNYHDTFWTMWYLNVFNLITADSFGLAVWSIILQIPLFINPSPDDGKPLFGFNELVTFPTYINDYTNFNNGNFSSQSSISPRLTIEEQRLVLRLRYYQLISRGAAPEVNKFLSVLFADFGPAYMLDGLDMSITYIFDFKLSYSLRFILEKFDLLPRPAGVKIKYIIVTNQIFGFNEVTEFPSYINVYNNFNNSNFIPEFS